MKKLLFIIVAILCNTVVNAQQVETMEQREQNDARISSAKS